MVLLGLFSYVIPNDKAGPEWTAAQFEELQLLVCVCVCVCMCVCVCVCVHYISTAGIILSLYPCSTEDRGLYSMSGKHSTTDTTGVVH